MAGENVSMREMDDRRIETRFEKRALRQNAPRLVFMKTSAASPGGSEQTALKIYKSWLIRKRRPTKILGLLHTILQAVTNAV